MVPAASDMHAKYGKLCREHISLTHFQQIICMDKTNAHIKDKFKACIIQVGKILHWFPTNSASFLERNSLITSHTYGLN